MTESISEKKELVKDAFGRSAIEYDFSAIVQRLAANQLVYFLEEHPIQGKDCLEIGCGTGFLTEKLLQNFEDKTWTITDISPHMLSFCREKLLMQTQAKNVAFHLLDGQNLSAPSRYDLIVSGLTFQWFVDFESSLRQLQRCLNPNGWLVFSVLTSNSFNEWKTLCQKLEVPFTGNKLPQPKILTTLCEQVRFESLTTTYANAREFFRHLKKIGAGVQIHKQGSKQSHLKHLIQGWDEECPDGISVTYDIAYCAIKGVR